MNTLLYNIDGGNILGTVDTVDDTVTIVDKIDNLTDDSSHLIQTYVTTEDSGNTAGGVWVHNHFITKRGGVVVIENTQTVYASDDGGGGLQSNSVTFVVNGGDVDIKVEGEVATNYTWNSMYMIILKTTN